MPRQKKSRTQPFIGSLCLLAYLLVWAGSSQGLPLLLVMIGNTHKIFLTKSHDRIHLVLHHPGNQDEHESPAGDDRKHEHDILDKVLSTAAGQDDHSDHEFHVSEEKQLVIAAVKTIGASKTDLAIAKIRLVFIKSISTHFLSDPPPKANPTLVSLHTTVLLI